MERKYRVIQYGLGPIGNIITQYILDKDDLEIVAAIDIDPDKVGKDIGELAGLPRTGVTISDKSNEILKNTDADIVVLTTTSDLEKAKASILEIVSGGLNVVSTCEELSYPWITNPEISAEIDAAAKANGVSVLGTGVNPGFLMDFLPLSLTALSNSVKKIRIERIQNAAFRRLPFQQKIGAGLTPQEFELKVKAKALRHVGLTESIHMIASTIGWKTDRTEDVITPVIAEEKIITDGLTIEPGNACGVNQIGRGFINGEEVITLVFRATVGEKDPHDRIVIEGNPPIDMSIKNGINGDVATCSITVNAIPVVVNARPGLRTMANIEPVLFLRQLQLNGNGVTAKAETVK